MAYKLVFVNDIGRRIGSDHQRAKLDDAAVEQIHMLRDAGLSYSQIARKFDDLPNGISKSTVRDILVGRRRGQLPAATRRVLVRALEVWWGSAHPNEFDAF